MAYVEGVNTNTTVWRNGQADTVQKDGYEALLRALVTHASGQSVISSVARTGGSGQIDNLCGGVGAPSETWTVTFTDSTNFTVSGSTSGSQAGGTVGSDYKTNGTTLTALLQFKITGSFSASDYFTIGVTATTTPAAERWVLDRWDPNADLGGISDALIWHGPGDGTQAIYAGIRLHENAGSSIWNWKLRGYTGFVGGSDFENQPGTSAEFFTSFWDNDMVYWIASNARRYIVVAKVSTRYFSLYQGLVLPFGSPNEYPYPLAVFGTKKDEEAWNSSVTKESWCGFSFPMTSGATGNGQIRDINGDWLTALDNNGTTGYVDLWPNGNSMAAGQATPIPAACINVNGDYQLLPIMIVKGSSSSSHLGGSAYGILDGACYVSGFGNSPETILTIGGTDWVCFQEIANAGVDDFYAVEMD